MRGRRPTAVVRGQVLAAAGELLLAEGMGGFTVGKVAAKAGSSRTTIHKCWPSRGSLALDGYASVVRHSLEFPTPGTSRPTSSASCCRSCTWSGTAPPWGAVYHRLLIPDEPLTDEFARALVANILPGLRKETAVTTPLGITPAAVQAFVDATNAADTEAFLAVFTEDAFLADWGRQFHGHDGVASWNTTDNIGVQAHFDLVSVEPAGEPDSYTVTIKVRSRRFDGAGAMAVRVRGDKIASLVIS